MIICYLKNNLQHILLKLWGFLEIASCLDLPNVHSNPTLVPRFPKLMALFYSSVVMKAKKFRIMGQSIDLLSQLCIQLSLPISNEYHYLLGKVFLNVL